MNLPRQQLQALDDANAPPGAIIEDGAVAHEVVLVVATIQMVSCFNGSMRVVTGGEGSPLEHALTRRRCRG
jgi:hypothetical protein